MAKPQSIDPNSVPQGKIPSENTTTLAGQAAKEFRFQVNSVDQVKVKVKQGSKPVAKSLPDLPAAGSFAPHRLVINLGFVEEGDESRAVTSFSPGFELRLRYNAADLQAAGGRDNLKVAYYAAGAWVTVSASREADYPTDPNSEGYLLVASGNWPADPPVAIGH